MQVLDLDLAMYCPRHSLTGEAERSERSRALKYFAQDMSFMSTERARTYIIQQA